VQSSSQIVTTNKPTPKFFTGRMTFLSPNQQCQSTEGKISHSKDLLTPSYIGYIAGCSLLLSAVVVTDMGHGWARAISLDNAELLSVSKCSYPGV